MTRQVLQHASQAGRIPSFGGEPTAFERVPYQRE
jgi:hypothetical protein